MSPATHCHRLVSLNAHSIYAMRSQPICNSIIFGLYPQQNENTLKAASLSMLLSESPALTGKPAWPRLSANSLQWAGAETSQRSWSQMVAGAEPGPYTEAKTELDINCRTTVVRWLPWSEGGTDSRQAQRAAQEALKRPINRLRLFDWAAMSDFLSPSPGERLKNGW